MKRTILTGLLLGVIALLGGKLKTSKATVDRLSHNIEVLHDTIRVSSTRQSELSYTVSDLQLTLSEFKKLRQEDVKLISDLRLKEKNLESLVKAQSSTTGYLTTILRDTTVLRDTVLVEGRSFIWRDPYLSLQGLVIKDTVDIDYTYKEGFSLIQHEVNKGWWIFKRRVRSDYTLKPYNPRTVVSKLEIIKLLE